MVTTMNDAASFNSSLLRQQIKVALPTRTHTCAHARTHKHANGELYMMTDLSVSSVIGIIAQCIHISNHYIVYDDINNLHLSITLQ